VSPFSATPATEAAFATGMLRAAAVGVFCLAQAVLLAYSAHRYVILARAIGLRRRARALPVPGDSTPDPAPWPEVTVQLPLYNERRVAERLIGAVAALDYPRDRFEIQVLDDSTDDTRARVDRAVAAARAAGARARVLRRASREGFKSGALANGLASARGELIAIFDADFVPPASFLRRMVPHFRDPRVGLAQARWGHLNRARSALTAAQAVMLDAHFRLEHRTRAAGGLFFNFNGTAGVWRRRCIEAAGGWSSDTLTEDLDLSYRAQLAGWKFVYDGSLEVPGELPAEASAFRTQQRRWAKGSIQTARKVLPALLRSELPRRVKLEAVVHLTGNAAYPLLMLLTLTLAPVLFDPGRLPPALALALALVVLGLGIVPVAIFLAAGQWGRAHPGRIARDVLAALALGAGLAPNNTRAVLEALGSRVGEWERTPKTGEGLRPGSGPCYRAGRRRSGALELGLAAYLGVIAIAAWSRHESLAAPFLVLPLAGFADMGVRSLREAPEAAARGGPVARS
jgi:hypothetical protein